MTHLKSQLFQRRPLIFANFFLVSTFFLIKNSRNLSLFACVSSVKSGCVDVSYSSSVPPKKPAPKMTSEKVNEFLREISPMREASFWHHFIARFLKPPASNGAISSVVDSTTNSHQIDANIIGNDIADCRAKQSEARRRSPPPLPPKPKVFNTLNQQRFLNQLPHQLQNHHRHQQQPLQAAAAAKATGASVWAPSIVITQNDIDNGNDNHRPTEHCQASTYAFATSSSTMGAVEDDTTNAIATAAAEEANKITDGKSTSAVTAIPAEISNTTTTANTWRADSNNIDINNVNHQNLHQNHQSNIINEIYNHISNETNTETVSYHEDKKMFQSKSTSPSNMHRTQSEAHMATAALFQRSNSVPNPVNASNATTHPSQQPLFTSSSFYDPRMHPTLEEQVNLCRTIAKQLVCDASNAKSKGREMFERRVKKSSTWVTENEDSFQNFSSAEEDFHERTISDGPPNLRLLLDPRHVEDISTVQGVNEQIILTQEEKTRDSCKHIVQDLMSPKLHPNRGNMLFAKRVQKSDEWIIDEVAEQVVDAARDKLFRNMKQSGSSSPISALSASRYGTSSPIAGPVFIPLSESLPPSRPASAMSLTYSRFRDFNPRPKPFCRAY